MHIYVKTFLDTKYYIYIYSLDFKYKIFLLVYSLKFYGFQLHCKYAFFSLECQHTSKRFTQPSEDLNIKTVPEDGFAPNIFSPTGWTPQKSETELVIEIQSGITPMLYEIGFKVLDGVGKNLTVKITNIAGNSIIEVSSFKFSYSSACSIDIFHLFYVLCIFF